VPSPTSEPRWVRALDLALEVLLVGFAVYTVVHLLGAEAGWGVRTTGLLWLVLAAPAMAGAVWWGRRATVGGEPDPVDEPVGTPPVLLAGFAALALVAAVGCAVATGGLFTLPWALALLLVLGAAVAQVTSSRWSRVPGAHRAPPAPETRARQWEHVAALALAVGVGVLVLFVLNPSRDDVYYLNRAAWVAEQGTFPERDTMFGPLTYPATYGAGLPVAALEEAYGSLARLFGVPAAGLAYLVANPLFAGLSVWALWRLVRAWAPRRALLALLVAVAVPLSTGSGLLGEFAYAREWQGKVVVILLVMPLVWVHLTRLARGAPPAWSVSVLGVLGVAWCGLTITAPIFAGLLAGIGLLGALLLPDVRRPLGLGALALAAAPVVVGVATVLTSSGPVAEENFVSEPALAWAKVLGDDRAVVALLGLGLLLGPLLARGREARLLAALAAAVTLAVLLPGVFDLLDALTGTGPIAVRMLLTAPFAVLVGLLVTAPLPASLTDRLPDPRAVHLPGVLATVLVLGLLATTGTPVWSREAQASLASSPTWKVKQVHREHVEAVIAERPGPGPVLLPPGESRTLAITTTEVVAVVPRDYYIQFVQEPQDEHDARYAFRRFMDPTIKDPTPRVLSRSLEALQVSLACVPGRARAQQAALREAGLTGERPVAGLVCFDGPGLTPPAGRAPAR
jgi:hypothetical protein